ncbi:hypothetical protein [Mycobacterium tuberculosis]|nr:hypothetical protein [Mycobacterium tuberculosis]
MRYRVHHAHHGVNLYRAIGFGPKPQEPPPDPVPFPPYQPKVWD